MPRYRPNPPLLAVRLARYTLAGMALPEPYKAPPLHGRASWSELLPRLRYMPGGTTWHSYQFTFDADYSLRHVVTLWRACLPRVLPYYGWRVCYHALLGAHILDEDYQVERRATRLHSGEWRNIATAGHPSELEPNMMVEITDWIARYRDTYRLHGIAIELKPDETWTDWEHERARCAASYRRWRATQ